MTQQEVVATPDVVIGMVVMFSTEAYVLIDQEATHSLCVASLLHVWM